MSSRSLAALACSIFLLPAVASANTDVHAVNGVEIITFTRDPAPAHRKAISKPHTTSVAAASTLRRRIVVTAPDLRGATTLVANAMRYVGTPYVWGGQSPGGFDCSGFIYYLYAQMGIRIPRTADVQFAYGRPVAGDPMPGDLVFFQTYDYGASHVGLYLGEGRFVNSIGANVHVATFNSPYFRSRYLGARRFLSS